MPRDDYYSPTDIVTILSILHKYPARKMRDARAEMGRVLGRAITASSLSHAFSQRSIGTPSSHCLDAPKIADDPRPGRVGDPRGVSDRGGAGIADALIGAIAPGKYRRGDTVIGEPIRAREVPEARRESARVASSVHVAHDAQLDQNGQLDPRGKSADSGRGQGGEDDNPYPVEPVPTIADLGAAERDRRTESDARRDLRRTLRHVDDLEETIRAYERYTSEPIRPVRPTTLHSGKRPAAAVALLSDVHAEESVARTDAIRNEYSLKIAERRVSRFFAGVVWLIKHAPAFDIDTLVLWLGGDLISGDIHDELLERCEVPPAEATLIVRDWIVAGLRSVLAALPEMRIVVPCSCGNHSRTTKKMRPSTGYGHSWEWLLYQVLGHDFKDEPRIQFHATRDEMQYVTVHGFNLAFHHGHNMRYQGGIGGVTIPAIKAVHRWQNWRDCDWYNFGHFHTRLDLGQIAFNGSVIGPSPYGFALGCAPEPPQQSFYILDDKRGKTMASPVWVAE